MTENKRFTYDNKTVSILKDGEFWLDGNIDTACNHSEICGLLNELYEENQKKQKLIHLAANKIDNLLEENEHIKQTIKTMMGTERTALGKSVLKQLWEAIQ